MAIADFFAVLFFIRNVFISVCKPVAYIVNYDPDDDINRVSIYLITDWWRFAPSTLSLLRHLAFFAQDTVRPAYGKYNMWRQISQIAL